MNQPDGQPETSVISNGQGSAMAAEDTTGRTTGMSKVDGDMKPISVSTLVGKNLDNLEGDVLGDVEYVVAGNKEYSK